MKHILTDGPFSIELDTQIGIYHVQKNGKSIYKCNSQAEAFGYLRDAKNEELGIHIDLGVTDYKMKVENYIQQEDDYYSSYHKYLKCYNSFSEKELVYDSVVYIDNYRQLINLTKDLSRQQNLVYRGINNSSYKSYSSSQRRYLVGNDSNLEKYGKSSAGVKIPYKTFIENVLEAIHNNEDFNSWMINKGINDKNDFLILAALQHYVTCAPLLDLSTNIYSSLYFSIDNARKAKAANATHRRTNRKRQLSDYVTLYVVDSNIDWIEYDIQKVVTEWEMKSKKLKADPNNRFVNFEEDDKKRKDLPYEAFSDVNFVTVRPSQDPESFVNNDEIRKIFIWNERVAAQDGFFILNNTNSVPLFELLKESGTGIHVTSYEINKKLLRAVKRICKKNNIHKKTVYPSTTESSKVYIALRKDISNS